MPPRLHTHTHIYMLYKCLSIQTGSFYSLCLNRPRNNGTLLSVTLVHFSEGMDFPRGGPYHIAVSHFTPQHDHVLEAPVPGRGLPAQYQLHQVPAPSESAVDTESSASCAFRIQTCQMGRFPLLPFLRGRTGVTWIAERGAV